MKNVWMKFACLLLSLMFCACGGGDKTSSESQSLKSVDIHVDGTEVYGDAGNYFAVVPGNYTINVKEGKLRLNLKLKVLKSIGKTTEIKDYPMLDLLDEDGAKICFNAYGALSNEEKFLSFLRLEEGEERNLLFVNDYLDKEELELILTNVESISADGLSFKNPMDKIQEPIGDLFEEAAKQAGQVDEEDLERAVETTKKVMEASKSTIDMLNQLEQLGK